MKTSKTHYTRIRIRTCLGLAMISAGIAVLGLSAAGNGSQAYAGEPLHMTVSYADLNLQAAAGVVAADRPQPQTPTATTTPTTPPLAATGRGGRGRRRKP